MIEVTSRSALERCVPNVDKIKELDFGSQKLHVYCKVEETEADIRCRMFAPTINIPEDPATGSANGALAAFLSSLDVSPQTEHYYRIIQGVEMGRPSLILANTRKENGQVYEVKIGGNSVEMMTGSFSV
jgi:trans-2,3-dihydro-3-hydroxyanthranilate isomerase